MKIPDWLPVFGDRDYRGECPKEASEQRAFFRALRQSAPALAAVAVHIRNEQFRSIQQTSVWQAEGMSSGAPDIIIPGVPTFLCEMKRQDHTKSNISNAQIEYLFAAQALGSFVCVALGAKGAWQALTAWAEKAGLPPPPTKTKIAVRAPKKRTPRAHATGIATEILDDDNLAPYLWA